MNVLLICLEDACPSGSQERQLEYAKLLSNYYIIERSKRGKDTKDIKLADNLFIFYTSSINKISFIYDAFRIGSKICKENKIDLISCQDPFSCSLAGYLLKKRFGIPLNVHILADIIDNLYFLSERKLNYPLNKLAKWIVKKADTIRVMNSKQKEDLVKFGIEEKKIWYIPVFINFNLFLQNDGQDIRRQYLSDKFDRLVLYVGRIVKQKNLETLIQAIPFIIRQYPKVLFLIIGQGPEERRIRNLVLSLGIKDNVCFMGNVSHDKTPDFFSACDLFVITSLYEGLPIVLLEAAASKKPIISTSYPGAYAAIEDGKTGFIVNFKDSMDIARRVIYLLENPEIAKEMGEKGQKFVLAHFDKNRILKDYLKMFKETAGLSKNEDFSYHAKS